MIYLDTSVAVPMFVLEAASDSILSWLETSTGDLVSADWILTEFASALSTKVRSGDLSQEHAKSAWDDFEIFSRSGLRLLPVSRTAFTHAAELIRKSPGASRAGDALHLAMALEAGASIVATADDELEHRAAAQGLTVNRF